MVYFCKYGTACDRVTTTKALNVLDSNYVKTGVYY